MPTSRPTARRCTLLMSVVAALATVLPATVPLAAQPGPGPRSAAEWEAEAGRSPGSAEAHYRLGRAWAEEALRGSVLTRARLTKRILRAWERAIALDSTYDAAYLDAIPWYAQAPEFVGGSTARAEALLAQWLRIHPYVAGVAQLQFDVARNLPRQAVAHAESLVRAFPDSARPAAALALAYQRASRFEESARVVDRALVRWPGAPHVLYAAGRHSAITGEHLERGDASLRQFVALAARDTTLGALRALARAHLGRICERLGDVAGARAEYRTSLALDRTMRSAREGLARLP